MKATAQTLVPSVPAERGWVSVFLDLFKARLTFLVLLTTLVGFYIGWRGPMDYPLMIQAILGTALVASGAAALNQLLERDYDARMRRTRDRPLPSGRLQPGTVLVIGVVTSAAGLAWLAVSVNWLTALLGAFSLGLYLFVYTPLKRVSWMNTLVGAIPGALPPLMGWTAARGSISAEGLGLFGILAFWQMPHFMAIAWMYRDEYAKAGFKMLPGVDAEGHRTGMHAVSHAVALLAVSLSPFAFGLAGTAYLAGALVLGMAFAGLAVRFSQELTLSRARQLFYMSIIYLPVLLGLMAWDKR
jgi:protoheme IX farnesyltransferase